MQRKVTPADVVTKPTSSARPARRRNQGFTLVELCIAMGIMTVAMIPLLGLMANGLLQVGSNIDNVQAVNICQQVYVAAQQQSFYQLSTGGNYQTYFTSSGDSVPAGNAYIVYTASVTCTTSAVTGATTPPLVTLSIKIYKTPGGIAIRSTSKPVSAFVGAVSCPDISGYNAKTD
jgi:uncharacterized protein (TIGR02598 family)